jgi:chemotaxis protein methyltransferase CheR
MHDPAASTRAPLDETGPNVTTSILDDAPAESAREFTFDARDFDRVRRLIMARAGIHLQAGKQAMVYSRLSRRLRDTSHRSFAAYLDALEQGGSESEWQEFVNCLTTNLTSFFREQHHFPLLAQALRERGIARPTRIWCAAASTGEEPYSLAMTAIETLGAQAQVTVVASDIDTKVLATAERGVYRADSKGLSPEQLRRFFLRGTGSNLGMMRVRPEVARLVKFQSLNLMDERWSLGDAFDIVFCRNVMIYFDAATQRRVLERIHRVMNRDGWLFVGHSENFTDARHLFHLLGKTAYRRIQT